MKAQQAVRLAWQHHTIVPAFNIPYLPMAKPVAQAAGMGKVRVAEP